MDAVITWVDGTDPQHKAKRIKAMSENGFLTSKPSNATYETRFTDCGEIYFSIASILKYAPFIETIYIITDDQTPKYLRAFEQEEICGATKIKVVSHKEIYQGFEEYLPTFNSLAIETLLWRIPGLSESFIYLNDDFFFNAPTGMDDFYDSDNKLKVCGNKRSNLPLKLKLRMRKWRYKILRKGNLPAHYKTAQMLSALLAKQKHYIQVEHHPHALSKKVFEDFFAQNKTILAKQIQPKFRTAEQFLPVGLNNHISLKEHQAAVYPSREVVYIKPNNYDQNSLKALKARDIKFACVQSLDEFSASDALELKKVLVKKFYDYLPSALRSLYDDETEEN